jgi:hypothetical protein
MYAPIVPILYILTKLNLYFILHENENPKSTYKVISY